MLDIKDAPTFAKLRTTLRRPFQVGLAAAVLTAVIVLFIPNSYRSDARLLPVASRGASGLGQFAGAAAALGIAMPGDEGKPQGGRDHGLLPCPAGGGWTT